MKATIFTLALLFTYLTSSAQSFIALETEAAPAAEKTTIIKNTAVTKPANNKTLVKEYSEAIATSPGTVNTAELYANRAKAYLELKDYKAAIVDYSEVLKVDKTNVDAYYNRGLAKMKLKDFRGGVNDLNKLLKIDPTDKDALYYRAICKTNLYDRSGAVKDYSSIIALDSTDLNSHYERGILYYEGYNTKAACADWTKIADKDERAAKALKKYCDK